MCACVHVLCESESVCVHVLTWLLLAAGGARGGAAAEKGLLAEANGLAGPEAVAPNGLAGPEAVAPNGLEGPEAVAPNGLALLPPPGEPKGLALAAGTTSGCCCCC